MFGENLLNAAAVEYFKLSPRMIKEVIKTNEIDMAIIVKVVLSFLLEIYFKDNARESLSFILKKKNKNYSSLFLPNK